LIARAAVDGISRAHGDSGVDIGAMESLPEEPALVEETVAG
jgi:small subunit ribosomal protein S2